MNDKDLMTALGDQAHALEGLFMPEPHRYSYINKVQLSKSHPDFKTKFMEWT